MPPRKARVRREDAVALLQRLVDRSLVQFDPATGRYHLLETVREYAAEQAHQAKELGKLRNRHASYYAELSDALFQARGNRGPSKQLARRRREEQENFRAALDWALREEACRPLAPALAYCLAEEADVQSWFLSGLGLLESALKDTSSADPAAVARCLGIGAWMNLRLGRIERSEAMYREAAAIYDRLEDAVGQCWMLYGLAVVRLEQGDLRSADELLHKGLAVARQSGNLFGMARSLNGRGEVLRRAGQFESAEAAYAEALNIAANLDGAALYCVLHYNLGQTAVQMGDPDVAKRHYAEATKAALGEGNNRMMWQSLQSFAYPLLCEGRRHEAGLLTGFGERQLDESRSVLDRVDTAVIQRIWELGEADDPEGWQASVQEGRSLTETQALHLIGL